MPNSYWQGVTTAGPGQPLFFSGIFTGLHRTAPTLRQTGSVDPVIPPTVLATEGYNHVGDVGYQGGRVLLPLECYTPGGPNGGNTCGTGAIGVADPATLAFQYYVKLDPAEIPKAMWVEASPDGELLWTSSGPDLLAYRASDVNPANAAPGRAGDPVGAAAGGSGPAQRNHGGGLLPRTAPARRRPGHDLPDLVGGPRDRRAPARGRAAARCRARPRASRRSRCSALGSTSWWRRSRPPRRSGPRWGWSTSRPAAGRAGA